MDKKTRKALKRARAIIRADLKKYGYRLRGSKWYMPTEKEKKRKKGRKNGQSSPPQFQANEAQDRPQEPFQERPLGLFPER